MKTSETYRKQWLISRGIATSITSLILGLAFWPDASTPRPPNKTETAQTPQVVQTPSLVGKPKEMPDQGKAKSKPKPTPKPNPNPKEQSKPTKAVVVKTPAKIDASCTHATHSEFCEKSRKEWVSNLRSIKTRQSTSGINITTYGRRNDPHGDNNTRKRRGFKENLIRPGSVALTPAIYNTYKPAIGSAVFINDVLVGYYEDRAPQTYNGKCFGKTVDIYDPYNEIGPVLKLASNAQISFGPPREQIPNPSTN
jgi:hypothetical protein